MVISVHMESRRTAVLLSSNVTHHHSTVVEQSLKQVAPGELRVQESYCGSSSGDLLQQLSYKVGYYKVITNVIGTHPLPTMNFEQNVTVIHLINVETSNSTADVTKNVKIQ